MIGWWLTCWTAADKPEHPNQMWERACSRKRCVSHLMYQLIHRIREQARSHILTEQDVRVVRSSAASHPANPTRSAH
ncbi:hypothetical protein DCC84_06930 [Pseudomonas sp. SXM-1]|nr:hypothetical protein DCC84_06930 [Pseudomonas sp. SXM-1]